MRRDFLLFNNNSVFTVRSALEAVLLNDLLMKRTSDVVHDTQVESNIVYSYQLTKMISHHS